MSKPLPDDLVVANCASCKALLQAKGQAMRRGKHLPYIAGRIKGRPYCAACLNFDEFWNWQDDFRTEGQLKGLRRTRK